MRCCSPSTRSYCSRSESAGRRSPSRQARFAGLIVALACFSLLAGCGEAVDQSATADPGAAPEAAGTLRIAVGGPVASIDPLLASNPAEQIASRQVHEPLISRQNGPFGQTRMRPGLVVSISSNAAATIWTAKLRSGVRFQDGEPMDADAVIANVNRWANVSPGPGLLPELPSLPSLPADSPQPGIVRFLLERAAPRFPRELSDPRLGLVAPSALEGAGSAPIKLGGTGTGPFELRESGPGTTLLARNVSWWGADLGLGPGVEQVELQDQDDSGQRADDLIDGSVEVAENLDAAAAKRVERDPLSTLVRGGGSVLGMARSVRGIDSTTAAQSLADVWLTNLR